MGKPRIYQPRSCIRGRPACMETIILSRSSLLLNPLLRCVTFRCPSMDSGNLRLQGRVHQPMTCKHSLFLELRRNDNGLERLSTASRQILNLNMLRLQLVYQFSPEQVRSNNSLSSIGHGCVSGCESARGNRKRRFRGDGRPQEVSAASAQQGRCAGVH